MKVTSSEPRRVQGQNRGTYGGLTGDRMPPQTVARTRRQKRKTLRKTLFLLGITTVCGVMQKFAILKWHPLGESNPSYQDENLVS